MNIVTKVIAPTALGMAIISGFSSMAFYGTEVLKHLSYSMIGLMVIVALFAAFYGLGNLVARRLFDVDERWFSPAYLAFGAICVAFTVTVWIVSYSIGQKICGVETPENGSKFTIK